MIVIATLFAVLGGVCLWSWRRMREERDAARAEAAGLRALLSGAGANVPPGTRGAVGFTTTTDPDIRVNSNDRWQKRR